MVVKVMDKTQSIEAFSYLSNDLLFYLTWPDRKDKIVAVALGKFSYGFLVGQIIDIKYFNFESPQN